MYRATVRRRPYLSGATTFTDGSDPRYNNSRSVSRVLSPETRNHTIPLSTLNGGYYNYLPEKISHRISNVSNCAPCASTISSQRPGYNNFSILTCRSRGIMGSDNNYTTTTATKPTTVLDSTMTASGAIHGSADHGIGNGQFHEGPIDESEEDPGGSRRLRVPLEFEASTERQHRLLRSIRLYAVGICAIAIMGVGVICWINPTGAGILDSTDTHTPQTNANNRERSQPTYSMGLPKVKQPKKLEEVQHHQHDESLLRKLREEFNEWAEHHGRDYGNETEKENRFHIWKENHFSTQEKNERHGPCKMTGKAVFGSNHFKDLTPKEFQSKYLTGYTGPRTDEMPKHTRRKLRSDELKGRFKEDVLKTNSATKKRRITTKDVLSSNGLHDPSILSDMIGRDDSVQERYLKHVQQTPKLEKTYYNKEEKEIERVCKCGSSYNNNSGSNNNYYNSGSNNNYYNSGSNYNYNSGSNYNYNNNYRSLKRAIKNSPIFGKTYYSKTEKQAVCGYSKSYYSSNGSQKVDCSKYKMEAGKNVDTSDSFKSSSSGCNWYDASCWLKEIFTPIYTNSERQYRNYNYPTKIDWRDMGSVTSVHSQGSCGACWAITAVETIEAVNHIKTGNLVDLSETEVIICDDTCEMCEGGWPQNAYEYVKENGGLPSESSMSYDGDFLMTATMVKLGESDELTGEQMDSVLQNTCPASGGNTSAERYGAITGYAYATDRCICYTDGSGCDCDQQNEALAVMNVASFGPATVCLEASVWQDYTGGIITSDSGCSSGFMDMNHCVQAVGYAFQEVSDDEDNDNNRNSHSGDSKNTKLEGYWIIRNQWSKYWGMNGYAYVAMGDNTCGVLNDMTQVFMD